MDLTHIKLCEVGKYLYKYVYSEGMGTDTIEFYKIVDIDDTYLTTCNVKVKLRNGKWYPSDELGTIKSKHKLVYAKKSIKAKKDKVRLIKRAIEQLNLPYCSGHEFNLESSMWHTRDGFELEND